MTIQTFRAVASYRNHIARAYVIQARSNGDAIMQAQKMFARDVGLGQTAGALTRVEFETPAPSA